MGSMYVFSTEDNHGMSRQLKSEEELQNTYVDERLQILIPKFEELVTFNEVKRKYGDKRRGIQGWKEIAREEGAELKMRYENPRTRRRQITALKKGVKKAAVQLIKDKENIDELLTITSYFGEFLSTMFTLDSVEINEEYRERVAVRSKPENRVKLNLSEYLVYANETLKEVFNGATLSTLDWRDVSCALALVTGRRMSELHLAGTFRQVNEYEVAFKGQIKGKHRKIKVGTVRIPLIEYEYTIPVLVKAEMVIAGIDWLEANGKRFPRGTDIERVNGRWGKVLSEKVKQNWKIFDNMTYHIFRACYLRCCIENANVDPYDWEDYSMQILGDQDSATIRSYKQFLIEKGSTTKI